MESTALRVCTFESRRQDEMANLIRKSGGDPFVAPSMRETPLENNHAVYDFADRLARNEIDHVIFMTGVGATAMFETLALRQLSESVRQDLSGCTIIARGPKPVAALSKLGIPVHIKAPEPNTWREIVTQIEANDLPLEGKVVAVQEYGLPSLELYDWLRRLGATVHPVPVYQWDLPEDVGPLQTAIHKTISGEFDVLLWTSAQQLNHTLQVADSLGLREDWLHAANRCVQGSIGPTASERLREFGLLPDLEPSHPKMAHLIRETLAAAEEILQRKRSLTNSPMS